MNQLASISFSIEVPMWQFITSQVFGVGMLVFDMIGFSVRRKSRTFLCFAIAWIFGIVMFALLGDWIGVGLGISGLIRNCMFLFLETRKKEVTKVVSISALMFCLVLSALPFVIFHESDWLHWVFAVFAIATVYGAWAKGIHVIRILNVFYFSIFIIHSAYFFNISNIIYNSIMILTIFIFYVRFFTKKPEREGEEVHANENLDVRT